MLNIQFPAVSGIRVGKEYYICMDYRGFLSKIFISNHSEVLNIERREK